MSAETADVSKQHSITLTKQLHPTIRALNSPLPRPASHSSTSLLTINNNNIKPSTQLQSSSNLNPNKLTSPLICHPSPSKHLSSHFHTFNPRLDHRPLNQIHSVIKKPKQPPEEENTPTV
ncbi:hypothetical protein PGT21_022147 [Puccinia graminis f. sp. tritici]|uniref:Uncharacterized protein n=1 Tax=Puccinia graminis f. sp. tritici TaxID=56615 RepID=A0A5B0QNA6_PUCGR|nr:hypothetical protein PGT21_022147 [Puccinia graminis f. sp. tritici]